LCPSCPYIHLLWPTQENTQYEKFSERPSPKIIAGEEEWKVERYN